MSSRKLLPGIWTPWAELLCYSCHGPETRRGNRIQGFEALCQPREAKEREAQGTCDKCQASIWLEEDLAAEQSVIVALKGLHLDDALSVGMQQTGGMCSAAGCIFKGGGFIGGRFILVTMDEEEEASFIAGLYSSKDDAYGGEAIDDAICRSVAEVVAQVRLWAGLPEDLMFGHYNVTADARGLIREVEKEAERMAFELDALIEEALEDLGRDALGDHSRGDDLAYARHEALKAEVKRLQDDEVQA